MKKFKSFINSSAGLLKTVGGFKPLLSRSILGSVLNCKIADDLLKVGSIILEAYGLHRTSSQDIVNRKLFVVMRLFALSVKVKMAGEPEGPYIVPGSSKLVCIQNSAVAKTLLTRIFAGVFALICFISQPSFAANTPAITVSIAIPHINIFQPRFFFNFDDLKSSTSGKYSLSALCSIQSPRNTIKPPSTAKNVVIASTTNQDNEDDETIVEIIYFSASYSMDFAPADG